MRLRLAVLFVAVFALWICLDGRAQTNAPIVSGAHRFEKVTRALRDVITQIATLRSQGLSADDAAQKVDVTAYRNEFASMRGVGIDVAAVRRIYHLTEHP